MEGLDSLLKGVQTLAIVCNQWGDTGKGKFVDYFAEAWADIIFRGTGSNNAGHTIRLGEEEYIFHLIPSGIINDSTGKINVLGNGVLSNLGVLIHEMDVLDKEGQTYNGFRLSNVSHLTTPDKLILEHFKERARGKAKIGTTMRGVGEGFSAKIARDSVRVGHLFNKDAFIKSYSKIFETNMDIARKVYGASDAEIDELARSESFQVNGKFGIDRINFDEIVDRFMEFGERLKPHVINTQKLIAGYRQEGKKILLEGAQGLLLSIEHGTYPFVTSSDPSAAGLASGCGIPPQSIDLVLGIVKMFYMTRVGAGPFPTEFVPESEVNASFNAKPDDITPKEWEKSRYDKKSTLADIGEGSDYELSRYCRVEGSEYGATTGRPRRGGWLDLVAMKYAIGINGPDVISTKTDVLDNLDTIKLCTHYQYHGPAVFSPDQGRFIQKGELIEEFPTDPWILERCKPRYISMPGWNCDTSEIRDYQDLPREAKMLFAEVEEWTGANIRIVSVGPDRKETIIRAA